MRISRLTVAFVYALLANTDILCYMLMILNHMVYASVLSITLPFLVFLWGMLSIPRPTKIFWITVMTYTQIVIVVKYLFKFQFIDIDDCNREEGLDKNSPMCPPRLFGIERDGHTSAYDLLLLLVLFFHRYSLKVRLSLVSVCRIAFVQSAIQHAHQGMFWLGWVDHPLLSRRKISSCLLAKL